MDSSLVYLVQTDTTVGFSSSDAWKLSDVKQRSRAKKILRTVDSFKTLKQNTRVPKRFRKLVRYSKKTTFIYPNLKSFRLIEKNHSFNHFLNKFGVLYSSSANPTGKTFDKDFALKSANILVEDKNNFYESTPSKIIKINKITKKRIR